MSLVCSNSDFSNETCGFSMLYPGLCASALSARAAYFVVLVTVSLRSALGIVHLSFSRIVSAKAHVGTTELPVLSTKLP